MLKDLLANALEQKPAPPLAANRGAKHLNVQGEEVCGQVFIKNKGRKTDVPHKGGVVDVSRKLHETRTIEQEPGDDASKRASGVPAGVGDVY